MHVARRPSCKSSCGHRQSTQLEQDAERYRFCIALQPSRFLSAKRAKIAHKIFAEFSEVRLRPKPPKAKRPEMVSRRHETTNRDVPACWVARCVCVDFRNMPAGILPLQCLQLRGVQSQLYSVLPNVAGSVCL